MQWNIHIHSSEHFNTHKRAKQAAIRNMDAMTENGCITATRLYSKKSLRKTSSVGAGTCLKRPTAFKGSVPTLYSFRELESITITVGAQ